jgi:hypothetical protein
MNNMGYFVSTSAAPRDKSATAAVCHGNIFAKTLGVFGESD